MRAGDLRDTVLLQLWSPESDPKWGPTPGYQDVGEIRAKVETVAAAERQNGHGTQDNISHVVTLRYRPDITSKDRLTWRGRTLDIVGLIDVDNRHAELRIECREHPEEGGQ
jgi:SPP1 family predicted phage head-tail adaptor